MQNCPSGQECRNDSILLDTRRRYSKIWSLENVEVPYARHHVAAFYAKYEDSPLNMVAKHTMEGCR